MRAGALPFLFLFLLLLAGCATVGHQEPGIDNFDRVSPTLLRGAQPSQRGIQTLTQMHVHTVLNLRNSDDTHEAQWVRDAGMTYIHLPLDAATVTAADAEHILTLLATAPTPIFVHCLGGRDRTGLAVAAYRLRVQGWNVQDAIGDLYAHGHFWLFYPRVGQAVEDLAGQRPTPLIAPAAEQN